MKKDENFYKRILDYIRVYGRYYREDRVEITRSNLINLQLINAAAVVITIILMILSPRLIRNWQPTLHYYFLFPLEIAFFIVATYGRKHPNAISPMTVEIMCAAFHLSLMFIFILISVFPYPNTPQIFITCSLFMIPTILVQRLEVNFGLTIFCETVFLILANRYKTNYCVGHDIFNTIASMLFSLAVLGVNIRLRIRDYDTRRRFEKLSQIDQLSGLMAKIPFEILCEQKCLSREENAAFCALLVMDLDNFKQINDTHGHLCGDAVLENISERLKQVFHEEDTIIGRIGGDEFAVFLGQTSGFDEVEKNLKILCTENKIVYCNKEIRYTYSIGGVVLNSPGVSYKELARHADKILYRVKDAAKNNYKIEIM